MGTRKDFLDARHSLLSNFFFFIISFARPASLSCEKYVYIHMSDCIEIVCEMPLLPHNTASEKFYTNQTRCHVLTRYVSLGHRPGGDRCEYVTLDKMFYNLLFR